MSTPSSRASSPAPNNHMLPVLAVLEGGHEWPHTLDPSSVEDFDASTRLLVSRARELAQATEQQRQPGAGGDLAPSPTQVEDLMNRWTVRAVRQADQLIRTVGLSTDDHYGTALASVITAALIVRAAEFDTGNSRERHDMSVYNRAQAAAEWVRLSLRTDPIDVRTAAGIVENMLPAGWRWRGRPTSQGDGDDALMTFAIIRACGHPHTAAPHSDSADADSDIDQGDEWHDDEIIRVVGERNGWIAIFRSDEGIRSRHESLTWTQMCQHIAFSQAHLGPSAPGA